MPKKKLTQAVAVRNRDIDNAAPIAKPVDLAESARLLLELHNDMLYYRQAFMGVFALGDAISLGHVGPTGSDDRKHAEWGLDALLVLMMHETTTLCDRLEGITHCEGPLYQAFAKAREERQAEGKAA